ncbi:hypothetical protein Tco_1405217 [Tanacetum coccineum]
MIKTDVLNIHKKLLAEAKKIKKDLKAKVEKWHNSSKNLSKLLNTQMSANDKFGLWSYGDHRYDVSEPVVNESNVECQPKVWSDAPIIEEYESDSEDEFNTAKASSIKNFSTARQSFNRQTVLTSIAMKVNTVKSIVNRDYPHRALKNKGIVDSVGCSRHLTKKHEWWNGNKPTLLNFKTLMWPCLLSWRVLVDLSPHNKTPYELLTGPALYSIWPSYSSTITPALKSDDKREGPREEEQVFMDELERLKRQEKEANEEAEALRKKFETLVIQEGATKTSSTNIFSTVSTPAKASSTNLVNTVSIPVSTASPHEGLSLSDPTNLRR